MDEQAFEHQKEIDRERRHRRDHSRSSHGDPAMGRASLDSGVDVRQPPSPESKNKHNRREKEKRSHTSGSSNSGTHDGQRTTYVNHGVGRSRHPRPRREDQYHPHPEPVYDDSIQDASFPHEHYSMGYNAPQSQQHQHHRQYQPPHTNNPGYQGFDPDRLHVPRTMPSSPRRYVPQQTQEGVPYSAPYYEDDGYAHSSPIQADYSHQSYRGHGGHH